MFAHVIYAQNMMIKGTVIDANNDPLLGVTIMVKGTTTGTITDVDGNFLIKNRHKTQRKAKFYLNNWRSVFYMQGGLKQALA